MEEILEVQSDENKEEVLDTNIDDNTNIEQEDVEDKFNPDTLFGDEDLEEQQNYQFGQYDLSKYKDELDFSDEEMVSEFKEYAQKYEELGFTQAQIEFILDERIKQLNEIEEKKQHQSTQKEIKERLINSLTTEEKRNYKPTYAYVKDVVEGTEFGDKINDIMMNPTLVKLFHNAYKKSLGKTTNINSVVKKQEKQIKSMSIDEAYDKLLNATKDSNIDKESLIKELKSSVSDTQGLNELLSIFGK